MAAQAPLAEVSDLADWLGEPISEDADVKRAESVLRAASALVRRFTEKPWLAPDGSLDPAMPDDVTLVTIQVAARGYSNPEGWANEAVDDWRGGGRIVEEAGLYLTASEKAVLGAHVASRTSGIGVLATTKVSAVSPAAGWVPTEGGPLFPWY